ncbi:hypothetical protein H920_06630 [Fukomys damarensis]|uniref:Uncharacterized protein n=1 Tax=Fukomys damarensis TaxID=885580 RepID=A0A091EA09_FUKDA|nr:hypothetical protein H920_06630 [Fukomys damarensis]
MAWHLAQTPLLTIFLPGTTLSAKGPVPGKHLLPEHKGIFESVPLEAEAGLCEVKPQEAQTILNPGENQELGHDPSKLSPSERSRQLSHMAGIMKQKTKGSM